MATSSAFQKTKDELTDQPRSWLVTGAAGFVGSNLAEALLQMNQHVRGLDNFATGRERNVEDVRGGASGDHFEFIEGDIRDAETCHHACEGVDYVLHEAALGSVPRSIEKPAATNAANVDGFLNVLAAARDANVARFVYASSSSVYGDDDQLPKIEEQTGTPLSPYAVSKKTGELYANVFQRHYGLETIGLRYFNVFGRRQDPAGAYAAVIPKWIDLLMRGERCPINGDGETSRDFCYVENVVQANILAACASADAAGEVYNVGCNEQTTLKELHALLRDEVERFNEDVRGQEPVYRDFREGDMRHSRAAIEKAERFLGYQPTHDIQAGLRDTVEWYAQHHQEAELQS